MAVATMLVFPPAVAGAPSTTGHVALARNIDLAVQDSPLANSSAVIASPPPKTPNTVPIVMDLVSGFNVTRHGLSSPSPKTLINGTAVAPKPPQQGWGLIELFLTGRAEGVSMTRDIHSTWIITRYFGEVHLSTGTGRSTVIKPSMNRSSTAHSSGSGIHQDT